MTPSANAKPNKGYKQYKLQWPNNLLVSIFGEDFDINTVTEDQLAAINYVIVTGLTDREQEIIHHRYQKQMRLVQIGEIIGMTRERVRQIEHKAIHKLKHPIRRRIIETGLNAFYEQDIKQLYYTRQNLLTTNLADIKPKHSYHVTEKAIRALIGDNFLTIGDLLDFNLHDKSRLEISQTAYDAIVKHYQSIIHEQSDVIATLEIHTGHTGVPVQPYPANLFSAIYGKNHPDLGAMATPEQIDGLNQVINNALSAQQRKILYHIYVQDLSMATCAEKMMMSHTNIRHEHRTILRILRQQPACYAYIDGTSEMSDTTETSVADDSIRMLDIHDNIKQILISHGITTIRDLKSRTDEELQSLPHIGSHVLSEVNLRFPDRAQYARTCAYMSGLNMAPDEIRMFLNSTVINGETAYNILLSDDRDDKNEIRKTVCMKATNIENMNLSVRAKNALRHAEIHTIDRICRMTNAELLNLQNIGELTLSNIRQTVTEIQNSLE